MNFQDSVFLISGIAYIGLILLPGQQTKKTFSMAIESVLWFLAALIMVANAFIQNNLLQVFTGIMYSFNCVFSYFGFVQWKVQWKEETSDEVQMVMWLWDIIIALCSFMKVKL